MLFGFGDIIADLSRLLTLEPGDVILTGTPTGSTVVQPGDVVEVEVSAGDQSSGRLRSPIVDPAPEIGALVHPEHYARVLSYVRAGVDEGARLAAGDEAEAIALANATPY